MRSPRFLVAPLLAALSFSSAVLSLDLPITDTDDLRQVCSGMWADQSTYINVTFDKSSAGRLAMVIYEYRDVELLGKVTAQDELGLPKTYVCTSDAVIGNFCTTSQLGQFIFDLPPGKTLNDTSIWSSSVAFSDLAANATAPSDGSFWNNPAGNPHPPPSADDKYTTPWRHRRSPIIGTHAVVSRQAAPPLWYQQPIHYPVRRKGYYCIVTVPVTVTNPRESAPPSHASYHGVAHFHNTFNGKLAAADYPKLRFYFILLVVYFALACAWGFLCYQYRDDLLPAQNYISALFGLLVIEMMANWAYYRYLNAHGEGKTATAFLLVVAILDAGRNALSLFLLLVVALGLSVVRETLPMMTRCRILAVAHFIFNVAYGIAIVEVDIDTTSFLTAMIFVIPLSVTMNTFLLWIMYAFNRTILELSNRKQQYKMRMFQRLYRILIATVIVILALFFLSSYAFYHRFSENYVSNSWVYRWALVEGWVTVLYLVVFSIIAFLWRPTGSNRR
ncbi:hypothetical protein BOTBODRAFT_101250 [Botryobasidium botryosum FD-172 SS1]|uniref:Uncharacterized protein n=1 Tax=Botryobasidium botryosum (strain FD-172 SS1) TaxID=930990 RepID=A0A067N6I8_BOTB1|nr:hypothetical protein BOTBODRAFT_101250 [Botryobasidium botryosum FD-172 SS1]